MGSIVDSLANTPLLRAAAYVAAGCLAALFTRWVLFPIIQKMTSKTRTGIDDQLILALRGPVIISLILAGIYGATISLTLHATLRFVVLAVTKTLLVVIWGGGALRFGSIFLDVVSRHHDRLPWIQPRTLPLLQITWKVLVAGGLLYFVLLSWRINPTSWVASAGVVGIAVGFAAKDTIANLFAGIFIVADAPYKIGDFVMVEDGLRGQITEIGIRSSRILTRDDIEVTVPNAVIAAGKIVNETGGPYQKMRVRVNVSVAYGSDVERVREILLSCTEGVEHVVADPVPRVRFRSFGASGLDFELLAWIERPVHRGRVLDRLNTRVYDAFNAHGIEIPYAKQDVYVKELPKGALAHE